MTIGLQGTWIVSVKSKSAAFPQRFKISGSDNDGTHTGTITTPEVRVTGGQWGVTIENNPTGPPSWRPSRDRLANFRVEGGFFKVDILSDDSTGPGADSDFNDLILTASKPLNSSEWIVYGTVKTYSGRCLFNPCFPFPWVVVDSATHLERLLKHDTIRPILERTYGSDVGRLVEAENFRPLMMSRGGQSGSGLAVDGATDLAVKGSGKKAALETSATAEIRPGFQTSYPANLKLEELGVLAPVFKYRCKSSVHGNAVMQFVEYDRTADELAGGVYTAEGVRETLGASATDDLGNYVFSFTRTITDLVEDALTDNPAGGVASVSASPDLIVQFPEGAEGVATYETAPFYDISNVRRIDLCIAASKLVPKPCRGGRVLQYVGNIPIVNNSGSTLHLDDGTITNSSTSDSGPIITRGAWYSTVEIRGCFEGAARPVAHYTMQYRVGASGTLNYLSVGASGLRLQTGGVHVLESYGPNPTALAGETVPAYRNIEDEPNWAIEVRHRRARVPLESLLDSSRPDDRDITFTIKGFDSSGVFVPGTMDTIKLLVNEGFSQGDIESIVVPGQADLGDCALLELPTDTSALEIKLRATDVDGFMDAWSLSAVRGSNHSLGHLVGDAYPGAAPATQYRFEGTFDAVTHDVEGYVVLTVPAPAGGWLGSEDFCAFSFELRVTDRITNGYTARPSRRVWDEVVGMRAAAPAVTP